MTKNCSFLILVFITCIFCSCNSTSSYNNSKSASDTNKIEVALLERCLYKSQSSSIREPFYSVKEKIWRIDNFLIEECRRINVTDNDSLYREETSIMFYRLTDIINQTVYNYLTFSDTSKAIKTYPLFDSSNNQTGGWWLDYKNTIKYVPIGNPIFLPDTIVQQANYGRFYITMSDENNQQFISECYFNNPVETEGTMLNFNALIKNDKIRKNITKIFNYAPENPSFQSSALSFTFLRDTLSTEEMKIFSAWINNTNK